MKILDRYILRKYFTTFFFTLIILIPIAIAIDVSEKVGKFLKADDITMNEIIYDYYGNFIINYGNTFMPLGLFIAVILFTSKMSSNSEIIAILSSGISFKRFLRPYLIGATIVTIGALYANHFVVPKANKTLEKFEEMVQEDSPDLSDFEWDTYDNAHNYRVVGQNWSEVGNKIDGVCPTCRGSVDKDGNCITGCGRR